MEIPIKWEMRLLGKPSLIRFLFNSSFLWAPGNNKQKQQKVKMFVSAASRIAPVARTAVSTTEYLCMWWNFYLFCELKNWNEVWKKSAYRKMFIWRLKVIQKIRSCDRFLLR